MYEWGKVKKVLSNKIGLRVILEQCAVKEQYYEMPEFVGFQTIVILDPYGMTFYAVGVFGLAFYLLFRSWSTYCEESLKVKESLTSLSFAIFSGGWIC